MSHEDAERIAHIRYAEFDAKRKEAQRAEAAKVSDLEELERIAKMVKTEKE